MRILSASWLPLASGCGGSRAAAAGEAMEATSQRWPRCTAPHTVPRWPVSHASRSPLTTSRDPSQCRGAHPPPRQPLVSELPPALVLQPLVQQALLLLVPTTACFRGHWSQLAAVALEATPLRHPSLTCPGYTRCVSSATPACPHPSSVLTCSLYDNVRLLPKSPLFPSLPGSHTMQSASNAQLPHSLSCRRSAAYRAIHAA